jgi:hypothetical protein
VSTENVPETFNVCRLEEAGYGVGLRLLELLTFREKQLKRETKVVGILTVGASPCLLVDSQDDRL